jgi:aminopeptidase N
MARSVTAGLVALVLLGGCSAKRTAEPGPVFQPGAAGIGDPYFPAYGNGGYDVAAYDLNLRYDPASGHLAGSATITARAVQDLSRFNLDLARLTATGVRVDGRPATFTAADNELVVTPAAGLPDGKAFTVVVDYGGTPGQLANKALGEGGWLRTPDGAVALGQPESASTWYPVNDHPADKATFQLAMTVPDGLEVISNGVPGPKRSAAGWTTWQWSESLPMASYLSTVVIGKYRVTSSTHAGRPMVTAIPESMAANGPAAVSVARTGEIVDFLAGRFGPYPFDAYGGVVIDDSRIGYALETQSRPVYGRAFFAGGPNPVVIAHELAHQWFGDSVALERWQDIWLNEGFATYAEWLWQEHADNKPIADSFDETYAEFPWRSGLPAGDPGADHLFGSGVYQRGGMTVYALRKTIGDAAFDRLIRTWVTDHRGGNVTTAGFVKAAEQISGRDLSDFFQTWLYGKGKPPHP